MKWSGVTSSPFPWNCQGWMRLDGCETPPRTPCSPRVLMRAGGQGWSRPEVGHRRGLAIHRHQALRTFPAWSHGGMVTSPATWAGEEAPFNYFRGYNSLPRGKKEGAGPQATTTLHSGPVYQDLATSWPVGRPSPLLPKEQLFMWGNHCIWHTNVRYFYFPKKNRMTKTLRRTQENPGSWVSAAPHWAEWPPPIHMETLAGAQAAINKHPDCLRKTGLPHFSKVEFVTASAQNICVQGPFIYQASCTTTIWRLWISSHCSWAQD